MGCSKCDHKEEESQDEGLIFPFKTEGQFKVFNYIRMALSLIMVFLATYLTSLPEWGKLTLAISGYVLVSYDVAYVAIKNIFKGEFFDENFLMTVGTIGAMVIHSYDEAVFVMVFYHIGEILEDYAESKSKRSIKDLINNIPLKAHIVLKDGTIKDDDPENIKIGDIIKILPGEKIPVDGNVYKGNSSLDMSSLTGESVPKEVNEEDKSLVYSGSINLEGAIYIKANKVYEDSTLSQILKLVESEEGKRSKSEKFISKFAKIYTPIVCLLAVVSFVVFYGLAGWGANYQEALYNACNLLIISCPCALVISIPLAFYISIGTGAKKGILIKGGNALEEFAKADTFVFDKTGTITKGSFEVTSYSSKEALILLASLESNSTHPISKAFIKACKEDELEKVEGFTNIPGKGIKGTINGVEYYVGDYSFVSSINPKVVKQDTMNKVIYIVSKDKAIGYGEVADVIKDNASQAMQELKDLKADKLFILSGDNSSIVKDAGVKVGISEAIGELLPQEKLDKIKELKEQSKALIYTGDGVNDAPSLLAADVGVSMGGLGSDAANESADVVILNDDLEKLAVTKRLGKRTMKIVYENIVMILLIKVVIAVIVLSIEWSFKMYLAVVADVGTTLLAILNCLRLWKSNTKHK